MSQEARRRASWKTGLGRLQQYEPVELKLDGRGDPPAALGPTFAIVTPSLNQGDFVESAVRSVLEQRYLNLDYVVQDGGSTDSTPAVLERLANDGLNYVIEDDDGQANAINRGFGRLDGEIMGWLNSDDVLLPGSLEAVADIFASRPEVDVVYGHRIMIDADGFDVGRWIMPKHDDGILTWADYLPQETMFWRQQIWEKVGGGLDETFRFALDWDLISRFQEAGATFVRIPRFLGGFRVHEKQKTSAEIDSLGEQEMQRLRTRMVGRPVSEREVHEKVKPYLARASLYSAMWKLGLVNYGQI